MKALIVLTVELPDPEAVVAVMKAVDPTSIPHFTGIARVVVDPHATAVEEWLDGEDLS